MGSSMLLLFFYLEEKYDSAVCLLLPENTFSTATTENKEVTFKKLPTQTPL